MFDYACMSCVPSEDVTWFKPTFNISKATIMNRQISFAEDLLLKGNNLSQSLLISFVFITSVSLWIYARPYWFLSPPLEKTTKSILKFTGSMLVYWWFSYRWSLRIGGRRSDRLCALAQLMLAPCLLMSDDDESDRVLLYMGLLMCVFDRLIHQEFFVSTVFLFAAIYIQPAVATYIPVAFPMALSYICGPAVYWELQFRTFATLLLAFGSIIAIWWILGSATSKYEEFIQLIDYRYFEDYRSWEISDIPTIWMNVLIKARQAKLVLAPVPALISVIPCSIVSFTGKPEVLLWALSNCAEMFNILSFDVYKIPQRLVVLPTLVATAQLGHLNSNMHVMGLWFQSLIMISMIPQVLADDEPRGLFFVVSIFSYTYLFLKRGAVLPNSWLGKAAILTSCSAVTGLAVFKQLGLLTFAEWQVLHGKTCDRSVNLFMLWQSWHMLTRTSTRPNSY